MPDHDKDKKDEGKAVDEARKADKDRPVVVAPVNPGNVNLNAYSEESVKDPNPVVTPSINEPKPDEQQAFKVPEDVGITNAEYLKQAYPEGQAKPPPGLEESEHRKGPGEGLAYGEEEKQKEEKKAVKKEEEDDDDDDYKPTHKHTYSPPPPKRK